MPHSEKKKSSARVTGLEKQTGSGRPSRQELERLFLECGLKLPPQAIDRFWSFHQLLRARNREADLTRLHGFSKIVRQHYVDCALTAQLTDLPEPLLDIGTGAGFPGLPLKIVKPGLKIILAESRGRKLAFLDEALQLLRLPDVEIYPHKVTARFNRPVKAVITRDLESINRTLGRAAGFLPPGGRVIFMKGPAVDPEIEAAEIEFGAEFRLVEDLAYNLGPAGHQRRLLVFERIGGRPQITIDSIDRPIMEIASRQNSRFKQWRKILDSRGIRKEGLALMSGRKQIAEVLDFFPERCLGILAREEQELMLQVPAEIQRYRLRPELFKELDIFGAGPPLLLIQTPVFPAWSDHDWPTGCTLFIPFQDPANIGAVIRSAAAFAGARMVLLKEAAHPFHPKSLRAAGPTVFRVKYLSGPSLKDLKVRKAPLLALAAWGTDLTGYDFPETFGLVPGLEGPGLPEDLIRTDTLAIPMAPGVESLNAASAVAVAMYEWRRKKV